LVRYDDVRQALRDPRLSSAATNRTFRRFLFAQLPPEARPALAPVADTRQAMMVYADGERHRSRRGTIQPGMTPRGVEHLRPEFERAVDDLLDRRVRAGVSDLIADLAAPLPMHATALLLGLPPADAPRFLRWAEAAFALAGSNGGTPAHAVRARRMIDEVQAYIRRITAQRVACPDRPPDLLDAILAAGRRSAAGEADGLDELGTMATFLSVLGGGFETATNLLGNGLLALLLHPDQMAALREMDDPAAIDNAIEELARYDAPVQVAARVATDSLEIGGKPIRRGEVVECWIGAANRDPDRFPNPDHLDLRRHDNRHLAFGHGPHFCVGAALARLLARIAIPAVLRRLPDLRLAVVPDELRWKPIVTFRALEALPVRVRPARVIVPADRRAAQ
jgi:cytochrome P450